MTKMMNIYSSEEYLSKQAAKLFLQLLKIGKNIAGVQQEQASPNCSHGEKARCDCELAFKLRNESQ